MSTESLAKKTAPAVLAALLVASVMGGVGVYAAGRVADANATGLKEKMAEQAARVELAETRINTVKEATDRQDERIKNIDRRVEQIARKMGIE